MLTRRVSIGIVLVVCSRLTGAARAADQAQSLGTFKGPVKIRSSFSLPGSAKDRTSQMTIKLRRIGSELHVETHDPDALGAGKGLTVTGLGRILSSKQVSTALHLEIEFGGAAYTQSIGSQLNHALSLVPAASGLSVDIHAATGKTLLELDGNTLKLRSTSDVTRGKIHGGFLKAKAFELAAPRQLSNSFEGVLQRTE